MSVGPCRASAWAAEQDASNDAGAKQPRRWIEQRGDSEELLGERRVAFGGGEQSVEIGVGHPSRARKVSWYLRQGEICVHRESPGDVDRLRGGAEEPSGQIRVAFGEAVAQRDGLHRRDGHALAINGVEA